MNATKPTSLAQKLLGFQSEIGAIAKDSDNPFYKSKYFDINKLLEVVKPVLSKHGIVVLQPLVNIEGTTGLSTILINSENSADVLKFDTPIVNIPDAQKMGASVTYFRRYALQSILGLQAEDDDGNSLITKTKAKAKPAAKKVANVAADKKNLW